MKRYLLPALVCATLASGCVHSAPVPRDDRAPIAHVQRVIDPQLQQTVQKHLAELVVQRRIPGMAVAVVRGSSIVASAHTGVRQLGSTALVAPGDLFHVASLAKPMTSTVIATLVEKGRLDWSTRMVDVFPEWRVTVDRSLADLTLEQILFHRAGFHPFRAGSDWAEQGVPRLHGSLQEQRQQFGRWLVSRPPSGPVGAFEYTNAGYVVAAAMAEKVSGQSWEDLISSELFVPLGMRSAGFGWPRAVGADQPQGHYLRAGGVYEAQALDDQYAMRPVMAPASDVHMNIEDLAAFAAAHLAGLRGENGLLKAATVQRLHRPAAGGKDAIAWYVDSEQFGEPWSQYTGATGTFRARIWIFPASNLAFVAAANADSPDVHSVASVVFQRAKAAALKGQMP